jgi:hypothetical protein
MLNDVDLIRLYSDGKKSYGIIPKFKQRLQIKRIKYPIPPEALYLDDEDAIEKFNKLKQLASKTTVAQRMDNSYTTVAQPPEPEPEPEPKNKKHITPDGVSESIFKDFLEVRKGKKAKWTETALKGLQREANKANMTLQEVMVMCCERGWAGFKAEWVKDAPANQQKDDKSWMFSNEGIVAKANQLGIRSEGLSYQQLKDKCVFVMTQRAIQ